MGKGSKRRREDFAKIQRKWDNINWGPRYGQMQCPKCKMITSTSIHDKCMCEQRKENDE